jgi:hypothetical protein
MLRASVKILPSPLIVLLQCKKTTAMTTSSQASRLPNILVRAGMRPGGFYSHVFGPAARISCLIFCTVDIINSSRPGTNYRLDIDE